jgi:phosphate transport system substrate-binding protein
MAMLAAVVAAFGISGPAAASGMISGAGATFPYPIYAKWAEAYNAKTGVRMNYQSIGSGGGLRQITSKTVDFGASDMPLPPEQLARHGLAQWPMVMGGVVPVINVEGIPPGQLKLDGNTLAEIYLGKIRKWNDQAIAELNPDLQLPDQAIATVHRSDGSGTTFIFVHYLSAVSPEFNSKVGVNTSVQFPGGIGGKGNEGVAAMTARTNGAIGYVEFAYALQNNMNHAQMRNRDGTFVAPSIETFQAAAKGADWSSVPGFGVLLNNQPGADSWPIAGATFILMQKQQANPGKAKAVIDFFDWAYRNGGESAEELHYVPMPEAVVGVVEEMWKTEIVGPDGKPVWTGP